MTTATLTLGDVITCYSCGTPFAMGSQYEKDRRADHKTFYCPNGHGQAFLGESEEERLRRQLKWSKDEAARVRAEADQAKASLRTTKGHITRLRKKLEAGDCPLCHRRFAGLKEHFETRHPGQLLPGEGD